MDAESLTRTLQASIAPVALISGAGLLIMSMTNRLGRTVDRMRWLKAAPHIDDEIRAEYCIQAKRAQRLRVGIFLAGLSVLFSALMIPALFATQLFHGTWIVSVMLLFLTANGALVMSVVTYMSEMWLALAGLRDTLEPKRPGR